MTPSAADLIRILPETIWCGFGVLLMLLQPYLKNRQGLTLFAMVGAAAGTLATYFGHMGSGFFGLIQFDTYSLFFHWLAGGPGGVPGDTGLGFVPGAGKPGVCGILCADSFCDGRYGRAGIGTRTPDGVYRLGNVFDFKLRACRLPARCRKVQRVGGEILPAGIVCDGVFPVRHRAGLRRLRLNESHADCFNGSIKQLAAPRIDPHSGRPGLQGGGGSLSGVDAGRL